MDIMGASNASRRLVLPKSNAIEFIQSVMWAVISLGIILILSLFGVVAVRQGRVGVEDFILILIHILLNASAHTWEATTLIINMCKCKSFNI